MKINMRKSILLITLTFALAVIMGGAASAATQFNTDVKYYDATTTDASILAGTATPITEFYTGGNVKKVVKINNTGDSNSNPAPTSLQVVDQLNSNMVYQSAAWYRYLADGSTIAGPAVTPAVYNPATGVWDISGNLPGVWMGYNNPGAVPPVTIDWQQMLIMTLTLGIVDQDTNIPINTATVQYTGPPVNIGGTTTGSAFKILAKSYTQVQKWVTAPNWVPITAAHYNDPVWLVAYVDNLGPSTALGVNINDPVSSAQFAYDNTRLVQYWSSLTGTWSTTPFAGASAAVINPITGWTWNAGNLPSGAAYMIAVPYLVKGTGQFITNAFTQTQTNRNANPAATQQGSVWSQTSNTVSLWVNNAADVSIDKKFMKNGAETSYAFYEDNLELWITVVNAGPDTAQNVWVTDNIDLRFAINYAGVQTSYNNGVTWNLNDQNVLFGPLPIPTPINNQLTWLVSTTPFSHTNPPNFIYPMPVSTAIIKIPLTVRTTALHLDPFIPVVNTANVATDPTVYNPSQFTVPPKTTVTKTLQILRSVDLSITKIVDKVNVMPGDVVKFTITANSRMWDNVIIPLDNINVQVTDILDPNKFEFISASFNNILLLNQLTNSYTYDPATGKIVWNVGWMYNGAWTQMVVFAKVKNDVTGTITNTATVAGSWQQVHPILFYNAKDIDPSNNSATATMNVGAPIPPLTVVSTTPSNNSDYYGLTKDVFITFSNVVSKTNVGTVVIKNLTTGKNISLPSTWTSGSQLVIRFAKSRLKNNVYQITIPAGFVQDMYGQKNAAMTLTFTAKA